MSRIEVAPEVAEDFDRIPEHLYRYEVSNASARMEESSQEISILEYNRLVGGPARADMRELIIGRLSHGYVAL